MKRRLGYLALCAGLCGTPALAHPGHGSTPPESVEHYVVEPVHSLPMGMAIGATFMAGIVLFRWLSPRAIRARQERRDGDRVE